MIKRKPVAKTKCITQSIYWHCYSKFYRTIFDRFHSNASTICLLLLSLSYHRTYTHIGMTNYTNATARIDMARHVGVVTSWLPNIYIYEVAVSRRCLTHTTQARQKIIIIMFRAYYSLFGVYRAVFLFPDRLTYSCKSSSRPRVFGIRRFHKH